MRAAPKQSRKPDPPLDAGQQGRNTGTKSTFCQYYIENNLPQSIRNQDPREALLKYADADGGGPALFRTDRTSYRDTEGRPIMDRETLEEADDRFVEDQKRLLGVTTSSRDAKRPRHHRP
mmetsp:Transcript_14905/g.59768  ORF Transcript_14905/g.59768 Transcript_14905/m.59768 type:complete len:120 (-) Transcript_14905:127-486(-)